MFRGGHGTRLIQNIDVNMCTEFEMLKVCSVTRRLPPAQKYLRSLPRLRSVEISLRRKFYVG